MEAAAIHCWLGALPDQQAHAAGICGGKIPHNQRVAVPSNQLGNLNVQKLCAFAEPNESIAATFLHH